MMSRLTGYSQEYDVPTNSGGTFWTAMIYSPSHCVKSAFYGNYNQPRPVYLGAIPPASLPSTLVLRVVLALPVICNALRLTSTHA